eukprot:gnl/MRDRNA2_/MRDRNA2_35968_c0_seq1.p1 gnl/MRDRNA2_/MRDRNA2_35968_c0~~gnl/MRDRNA2_/MRDRNA2_35968_c0_seq1.p1  ORF type:complete len:322 (-),score=68.39 gnl/MRDRNA2_/MRDRNA2_35968_c0_seq1:13-978(-)
MNSYVQLEDSSVDKNIIRVRRQCSHVLAVCLGGLGIALVGSSFLLRSVTKDSHAQSDSEVDMLFNQAPLMCPLNEPDFDDTALGKLGSSPIPVRPSPAFPTSRLSAPFAKVPPASMTVGRDAVAEKSTAQMSMAAKGDAQMPAFIARRAAALGVASTVMMPFSREVRACDECGGTGMTAVKEKEAPMSAADIEEAEMKKEVLRRKEEIDKAVDEKRSPPVFVSSSPRAISLAKHLKSIGAKMYGAYWCSHCYDQKRTLGKEAMKLVTYIECSKDAKNSQYQICTKKNLQGVPTWEINGKLYSGDKSLAELEDLSDAPVIGA